MTTTRIRKRFEELKRAGAALSDQRHKVIPELVRAVTKQLTDLGFTQTHFAVAMSTTTAEGDTRPPHSTGFDAVEFQFAPNPGEPPRPLRAIASSGENVRVIATAACLTCPSVARAASGRARRRSRRP